MPANRMELLVRIFIGAALERELNEELFITGAYKTRLQVFVYDSSNARSSLHLGAIYSIEMATPEVTFAMEQEEFKERRGLSVSGKFFTPDDIAAGYYHQLEPWSQFLLVTLYGIIPPGIAQESDKQQQLW